MLFMTIKGVVAVDEFDVEASYIFPVFVYIQGRFLKSCVKIVIFCSEG